MDIYVSDFDEFEKLVAHLQEVAPDEQSTQTIVQFMEQGEMDGSHLAQLSADGSNVRPDAHVFGVVSTHKNPYTYDEGFFEKFQLVITFNDAVCRVDIFCRPTVDAERVFNILSEDARNKGLII